MTSSLFIEAERILRSLHSNGLVSLENHWSPKVEVFHPVGNVYQDVYGVQGGEDDFVVHDVVDAVVVSDDFFPSDSHSAGAFKEGVLYTTSSKLDCGDQVRICREDKRARRYKVISCSEVGTTTGVFRRFKISALGD